MECIKDIFGIITPLLTLAVAFFGLTTWRQKLWGENKFSLALVLLKELWFLKEEIRQYRNPFYSVDEIYSAHIKLNEGKPEAEYNHEKATKYAEIIRWNKVVELYKEYSDALVKYKVITNNYMIDIVNNKSINTFIKEINVMRKIKEIKEQRTDNFQYLNEQQKKDYFERENKILTTLNYTGPEDEIDIEIEKYFLEINKRVRKHIK